MSKPGADADLEGRPILDRSTFAHFAATYRRELKVHCYRMMGSLHEADDLVQDTLLRAWRARDGFDGRGSLRGWLYSIATNSCLNAIKARGRSRRIMVAPDRQPTSGPASAGAAAGLLWLEPYPDTELPDPQDSTAGPEARYEQREAIRFAFVAAIQELPPRQRAILLLADVLGWSAAETAGLLDTSLASVNSALQRARARLAHRYPTGSPTERPVESAENAELLKRYIEAWDAADLDAFVGLLRDDAVYHMPPWSDWYRGKAEIGAFFGTVWNRFAGFRSQIIGANGQLAVAVYARLPQDGEWKAHSLHLIDPTDGRIALLTVFIRPLSQQLFPAFGFPAFLPP